MNKHLENLKFIRADYDNDQWGQALDAAIAALAPPSGEGVDRKPQRNPAFVGEWHAKAVALGYDGVADMLDSVERGEPPQHIAAVLGATPQSAPVDGDALMEGWHSAVNDAGEIFTNYDTANREAIRSRASRVVTWLKAHPPTPPPASQERGRLQVFHCREADDGEAGCAKWCGNRTYCPVSGEAEPSPPSSAAEASINSHEIDSKLIPDATERAKPAGDDAIREQYRDGTFTRYFGAHPSEQAQAGESLEARMVVVERDESGKPTIWCDPEIVDLVTALNAAGIRTVASCSGHGEQHGNIALDDGRELLIAPSFEAARAMEAALRSRLASGVTNEMVRRLAIRLCEDEGIEPHELLWQGSPAQPKGEMWCEYTACARDYLISALVAK